MRRKLGRNFYTRPTLIVVQDLLGKYLIRKIGRKRLIGKIVETEAYIGPKDKASHAFGGKTTERNKAEYLEGGYIYIYLVYGMYWQLNISTSKAGRPECVLIRALEPISLANSNLMRLNLVNVANGPGKLCGWMKLDKSFYGEDLTKSKRIWVEEACPHRYAKRCRRGEKIKPKQIIATKRIGIDYAGPYWSKKKWRFYIKNNQFVSRK